MTPERRKQIDALIASTDPDSFLGDIVLELLVEIDAPVPVAQGGVLEAHYRQALEKIGAYITKAIEKDAQEFLSGSDILRIVNNALTAHAPTATVLVDEGLDMSDFDSVQTVHWLMGLLRAAGAKPGDKVRVVVTRAVGGT